MVDPYLVLPGEYIDVSGIVRVTPAVPALGTAERHALETLVVGNVAVAVGKPPSFHDQLGVYATPRELFKFPLGADADVLGDYLMLTTDQLLGLVRSLPFEPAMRFVAYVQRARALTGHGRSGQLALARFLYGESPVTAACAMFLRAHENGVIVSEQQLFALQRLLVLHARDVAADDLTAGEQTSLRTALLYLPGTILDADGDLGEGDIDSIEDERWVRYFIGNGGLAAHGSIKHDLARAHRMYEVIAKSSAARHNGDYCPLDEWLQSSCGLSFLELQAVGFALYAGSKIGESEVPPVALDESFFASTALDSRVGRAFDAIAGPREWFERAFEGSAEHPRRAAFETQPFLRRPCLRQSDGKLIVLAPRGIQAWLSATGAYYRFLDLARDLGSAERNRFSRFNGWLHERYVRHLTYVAHPHQDRRRLAGSGRVMPETTYRVPRRGESKTSDVAIDLGPDLILIEVTAKRITLKSLVEADASAVRDDLRMLVAQNMKQLGRVIIDLFADTAALPDVETQYVKRVWPIIVSADGLFVTPSTWAYLQKEGGPYLQLGPPAVSAQVMPLVLLDLEEFEALMGLVEAGHSLVRVLEEKTAGAWVERDFKAWLTDGSRVGEIESEFIGEELGRAFSSFIRDLQIAS
jgi:hypothetical protein